LIRVIFGEKGAGNSKRIIRMANDTINESKGSIVYIDCNDQYMFEIKRNIRFINVSRFDIDGPKMFYGFLCGIAAQDYDLEHLFIDGFLKIVRHDLHTLEGLFEHLENFAKDSKLTITLSISGNPDSVPDFLRKHIM